jgi:type II secretory pathway component PulF
MTYPLILIGFSIIVIVSLLAFVLPQVINQFVKAGADLPFITKLLLGISNNIVLIISMSLLVWISIFYLYKNYVKNINNKIKAHKRILKIPLIGNFLLNSELERFASTMELLLASGSNLDIALDESTKVFNNKYLENIITNSNNDVREGKDFINALKQ